ncbi:hypothetical protein CY34DRAFT_739309 [Suillus luteus UH-Slu-Lm8-n1]|uniref:Uncharacterized protein n=1 Tax=Suillus luteus UH-Slu-Lm8-n1 TaxID=930992 RepID=A0A0D0BIN1_9AGAM|nr:hypothetical protein CY34DRAFT_739309 [Suillus luteus UH-Slu-Lm8-n1]
MFFWYPLTGSRAALLSSHGSCSYDTFLLPRHPIFNLCNCFGTMSAYRQLLCVIARTRGLCMGMNGFIVQCIQVI